MAKPRKVEEPAASYNAKLPRTPKKLGRKAGETAVHYLDDATAKKLADQIFAEREDLLRKLAQ